MTVAVGKKACPIQQGIKYVCLVKQSTNIRIVLHPYEMGKLVMKSELWKWKHIYRTSNGYKAPRGACIESLIYPYTLYSLQKAMILEC